MGAGVNRVMLIGNLGADPKMDFTQSGTGVCNFPLALQESWTDKDGVKQERVEWARISVWGKQGELCAQYLSKGRQVYIEGRMKTSEYEKNGEKRYSTGIIANTVQFLGSKDDAPNSGGGGNDRSRDQGGGNYGGSRPQQQQQQQSRQRYEQAPAHDEGPIDDVPF